MYVPKPVDTSRIILPDSILSLTEKIAENVHEVWAQGRMAEGWTYGDVRDDGQKKTPCLVPYDALPEIEKDYDRNTAMQTLRLILALGYKIEKDAD